MKTCNAKQTFALGLMGILLPASSAWADQPIVFKPPQLGAPAPRFGGGTRGLTGVAAKIQVLAPAQTTLTSQAAPTLYWYLAGPSPRNMEVLFSLESAGETLLERKMGKADAPGIQAIRLADLGVELKPGVDYRWGITLVSATEEFAGDHSSSAAIRREAPPTPLPDPADMAKAGYWYDAMESLMASRSPRLGELLRQGGLSIPEFP